LEITKHFSCQEKQKKKRSEKRYHPYIVSNDDSKSYQRTPEQSCEHACCKAS